MKLDYVVTRRDDGRADIMIIQGTRCLRMYAVDSGDLRAAAQAIDDAVAA